MLCVLGNCLMMMMMMMMMMMICTIHIHTGGLAGVAGWAAIMPIDMAKSIIQTSPNPKRLIPTMLEVARTRGALALYSGNNREVLLFSFLYIDFVFFPTISQV